MAAAALPMFPLGTVLLPTGLLPLHVFEPRYRALVRTCLDGDRELGVVLIERGSEVGGGEVRSDAGTVARILEAQELPDGRWALLCVGDRRMRVARWLADDPHPWAEVEDWPDPTPDEGHAQEVEAMVVRLRRVLALAAEAGDDTSPATIELSEDPVLAAYQAATVAPLGPLDRQRVLMAGSPADRVALLDQLLTDEQEVLTLRLSGGG
jgi:Lon protease-like protein